MWCIHCYHYTYFIIIVFFRHRRSGILRGRPFAKYLLLFVPLVRTEIGKRGLCAANLTGRICHPAASSISRYRGWMQQFILFLNAYLVSCPLLFCNCLGAIFLCERASPGRMGVSSGGNRIPQMESRNECHFLHAPLAGWNCGSGDTPRSGWLLLLFRLKFLTRFGLKMVNLYRVTAA